jgi:hypothetical protein
VLDVPKAALPLLRELCSDRKTGPPVQLPALEDLAETLRGQLLAPTDTSLQLRFHDLRASGISWLAMLPDWTQFDVWDYAGHPEVSTTDLYVRRGRKARESCAQPFPELPPELVEQTITVSINAIPPSDETAKKGLKTASPTGFEPVLQP